MNQGVVQSSPAQQPAVAAGRLEWWSINNMRPPPNHHHHSLPPHQTLTPHLSAWSALSQELMPESWSQLLLGGLVGEEDKNGCLSHTIQAKKLENWEQQFLNQTSNMNCVDQFQGTNCWSHPMLSDSSPKSCVTTMTNNMFDFSYKLSEGKHPHQDPSSECNSTSTGGVAKKARIQPSSAQSTFKVRKEKLGDRITALHQLVSPFGKTDTASVLLEAIGYIRFLQSQIEALSLPYLGSASENMRNQHPVKGERNCLFPEDPGQLLNENCMKRKGISEMVSDEEQKKDLRSRGLCLVPLSCTLHMGSENGADYWAHAFGANFP